MVITRDYQNAEGVMEPTVEQVIAFLEARADELLDNADEDDNWRVDKRNAGSLMAAAYVLKGEGAKPLRSLTPPAGAGRSLDECPCGIAGCGCDGDGCR